jgi:hypothetical protein
MLPLNYTCYSGDNKCNNKCTCNDGYTGDYCEMTSEQELQKIEMRDMASSNLAELVDGEDATEDTVVSWTTALAGITSRPSELSENSTTTVLETSAKILDSADNAGLGYEAMTSLLDVIDTATKAQNMRYAATVTVISVVAESNNGDVGENKDNASSGTTTNTTNAQLLAKQATEAAVAAKRRGLERTQEVLGKFGEMTSSSMVAG